MTSPMMVRGSGQLLYPVFYSAAWQSQIWLPDQDWALSKDPEVWEKVRRDPIVEHAISARLHSIAAREWRVLPGGEDEASQRLAELVEDCIDEIEGLTAAQYQLAQAVMLGRSYAYMEGRREPREIEGFGTIDLWMPKNLVPIDRRRIRFVPIQQRGPRNEWLAPKVVAEISTPQPGVFRRLDDNAWNNLVKVVFDSDESRLGYGRGLLGAIYFYHYAKGVTLREGLKGVERWAQGLKVVKIDPDRAGSAGKTNAQLQQDYIDQIEKNMARNTITMMKGDEFEAMWPSGEGSRLILDMCNYLDKGVVQLILGSVLPTGGGDGGGSYARASVEEDASERLVVYDRRILDDALTRDLVGQFLRINRPQLATMGLSAAKKPRIRSVNEKRQDPEIASRIATGLLAAGIPLRADEVYEKAGYTKPKPGEEVIEGKSAEPPPGGGMPGIPSLDEMGLGDLEGGDDGTSDVPTNPHSPDATNPEGPGPKEVPEDLEEETGPRTARFGKFSRVPGKRTGPRKRMTRTQAR